MKIIPEVKCRRCGESFSALRTTCPSCGTRRVAQSTRTPSATPSASAGTPAYERSNVNTRWQMIFGLILVIAVIMAVIVMVSTGMTDQSYGTAAKTPKPGKTDTQNVGVTDAAPTPELVPTPSPSPTPSIQTLEIRYTYDDKKRDDVTVKIGEQLPLYAAIMPSDISGQVEWRIDDIGKDAFIITEDNENANHITVECVGRLPEGTGGVYIYAKVYGQEVKCMLHVNG